MTTKKRLPGAHKRGFELSANFLVTLILAVVVLVGALALIYQFYNAAMQ